MDFENPFAEEEEPEVIPNEPLLDYDNAKKEEGYNALVVLSSNLEHALAAQGKSDTAALATVTQSEATLGQTIAQQRHMTTLQRRALDRARAQQRQAEAAAHAATRSTVQAVMDDLASRLREQEERSQKLEHSASLYAQKLATVAAQTRANQAEMEATQTTNRPALLTSVLQGADGEDDALTQVEATARPALSATEEARVVALIQDVALSYTQRAPESVARAHGGEAMLALALAAAHNVTDALATVSTLDAHVQVQAERVRRGMTTLHDMDATRLRLARVLDRQQAQAALAEASPALAGSVAAVNLTDMAYANESLQNENRRLERALLALTTAEQREADGEAAATRTDSPSPAPSPALPVAAEMALHVAALEETEARLERESVALGTELLRRRRWLAAGERAATPPRKRAKTEVAVSPLSPAAPPPPPAGPQQHDLVEALARLASRLTLLDSSSSSSSSNHSQASGITAPDPQPFARVVTVGLESLSALQQSCLAPLQMVNEEMRRQASTAHLLRRLARHGTDFCNAVVNRVLEGCAGWLDGRAQELQEVVARACEGDAVLADLDATCASVVRDALQAARARTSDPSALSQREDFYRALIDCAVADPALAAALLGRQPALHGLTPLCSPTPLRLHPDATAFEATLAAELTAAEDQSRAFVDEATCGLREQVTEQRKKLTWFQNQAYTAPLRELHTLHKQNEALAAQLQQVEATVSGDGGLPEAQLEGLRLAIAQEENEARLLAERVEALRQRQAALAAEEAAALAFLRA